MIFNGAYGVSKARLVLKAVGRILCAVKFVRVRICMRTLDTLSAGTFEDGRTGYGDYGGGLLPNPSPITVGLAYRRIVDNVCIFVHGISGVVRLHAKYWFNAFQDEALEDTYSPLTGLGY